MGVDANVHWQCIRQDQRWQVAVSGWPDLRDGLIDRSLDLLVALEPELAELPGLASLWVGELEGVLVEALAVANGK